MGKTTLLVFLSTFMLITTVTWAHKNRTRLPPPEIPENVNKIEEHYFTQQLDHFNSNEQRTYQQRYQVTRKFYKQGGPAFFLFSGESEMHETFLYSSAGKIMMDFMVNAARHNAMVFQLEHRYYGKSVPVEHPDQPDQMKWLSARQALADTAKFIEFANREYFMGEQAKWIVFGGSYSGALAAWMRSLYPELVLGAISSSGGPMEPFLEFPGYVKTVSDDLKKVRQSCWDTTKQAFDAVVELMKTPEGCVQAQEKLNLCEPVLWGDRNSVATTLDALQSPFDFVCQYGGDNKPPYTYQTVENLCNIMENVNGTMPDLFDRLKFINSWQTRSPADSCIGNSFAATMDSYRPMNENRGWEYQKCTELGGFLTDPTDDNDNPFGGNHLTLDYRYEVCRQVFNVTMAETLAGLKNARQWHGAAKDFNGTNVVLLNGDQDPFHTISMYKEEWQHKGQTVLLLKGRAHCSDMYPHLEDDHPLVVQARKVISDSIDQWLA